MISGPKKFQSNLKFGLASGIGLRLDHFLNALNIAHKVKRYSKEMSGFRNRNGSKGLLPKRRLPNLL